MIFENNIYVEIDGQIKKLNERFKIASYKFSFLQNNFSVNIEFEKTTQVNEVAIAIEIENFEILFMPKLQKKQNGLVFSNFNSQVIVLRKGEMYFLLRLFGDIDINDAYFRFCTKVKGNLLYIGFFNSFAIDDFDTCFYYQNLLRSVYIKENTKVNIKIEIFEGSSLYDCLLKSNDLMKYYDVKYKIVQKVSAGLFNTIDISKYSNIDIAKEYKMSAVIPTKIVKVFFWHFPKKLTNFYTVYTSTLQTSSMYYLNFLRFCNKLSNRDLSYLRKQIESIILSQNVYYNFYRKNIMLTEIKTYYQLPYILLLYFQLCFLETCEPLECIQRTVEEIEYNVIKPCKFFSDNTLLNIENFETRFDNLLFAQETMTIYICYELYKTLFKYYEHLDYQKIAEDLKSLLILYYNFNEGYFYANNYSYKKEEALKLIERVDKR